MSFQHNVLYAIVMASVTLQVSPAWAKTVKCDQGKSLQTAIDNASEGDEIDVTGTCNEFIVFDITQHFLTLLGAPGAAIVSSDPGRPTIDVNQARRITISGFSISGGARGVMIRNGQAVLANNSISGSVRGVEARNNSGAILLNNMISDAAVGIDLSSSTSAFIFGTSLQNIGAIGFRARFASSFFVLDLAITGSPGRAIVVADNSAGTISGLNIALDSVRPGIEVDSGGSLKVDNANILSATLSSREEGFLRLSGVTLDGGGSPGAGITADGGSVHLSNGSVVGFEQAVFAADSASVQLTQVTLNGGGSTRPGIGVADGASVRMESGSILGFDEAVFASNSASVQLTDVTLDGGGSTRQGIGVAAGGSVRMEGGSIVGFQTGLFASHSANARLTDVTLNGGGSSGFGIESASGGSSVWLENSSVQGFDFGGVASDGSFVEVNGSNVVGDIRGLWVTGGTALVVAGSTISGFPDGVIVESGRIKVTGSTINDGLGLNNTSSAWVFDSQLSGNPSLSPGYSSSVRVGNTTMTGDVSGVRDCTLAFQDGTVVTGTVQLDTGCALELTPNMPGTYSIGAIDCHEMDVTTQVRLSGEVVGIGPISNCKVEP